MLARISDVPSADLSTGGTLFGVCHGAGTVITTVPESVLAPLSITVAVL